ncbi:hydrogenase expression/formation protein HypE [Streptomyces cirratus]|uniref:Hydrogenase expression/formation protein HypE n=1 Tax=Streptomyces cirratus TaxID=68187 RepID=A0ABQ3EYU0_9ACTN|nr:AIR synthase-related protein [Streptomyces cirratus]GHB74733.1 hydrogenase expression/formation protein HypE [Streptomyces cirratus]
MAFVTYTHDWDTAQAGFGPHTPALVAEALAPGPAGPAVPGPALRTVTRTYVVDPPFFGNGDIGRVAVCGAVNELAATGAEPRHIALALVLEAGLSMDLVRRLTASVRGAATEAGVAIAAVDTQVVRAGEADRVFVTATAFGVLGGPPLGAGLIRAGDRILVTGPLGSHAAHLVSLRDGLGYEHHVPSDCAPLADLLRAARPGVHHARAVTAGGLAEVLRRTAAGRGLTLRVEEAALPVRYEARVALDARGLAPLDAACAGCLCLFVPPERTGPVLAALRAHPYGRQAAVVGEVTADPMGEVEYLAPGGTVRSHTVAPGSLPQRLL